MVEQNKQDSHKSRKSLRKAARKAQLSELLRRHEEHANRPPEEIKQRKREQDKRDREATRELVRKQSENMDFSSGHSYSLDPDPAVRRGPRGGKYTEAVTKEGRPYRRYF